MAIVYEADLRPGKLEVAAGWLARQPWFPGDAPPQLEALGAFRFDDPDGEVGLQTHLVRVPGEPAVHQIPMTYRSAPLPGAEDALMGEMQHSVLGRRYVYDGCHDPVYVGELVRTVLTGDTQVTEYLHRSGSDPVARETTTRAYGSGAAGTPVPDLPALDVRQDGVVTRVRAGIVAIAVRRVLDDAAEAGRAATLTADWGTGPHTLSLISLAGED